MCRISIPPHARYHTFVLVESIEQALVSALPSRCTEVQLSSIFPTTFNAIVKRLKQLRENDVLPKDCAALYFPELLQYAMAIGLLDMSEESQRTLIKIRNRVAHPSRPLVGHVDDLQMLMNAEQLAAYIVRTLGG